MSAADVVGSGHIGLDSLSVHQASKLGIQLRTPWHPKPFSASLRLRSARDRAKSTPPRLAASAGPTRHPEDIMRQEVISVNLDEFNLPKQSSSFVFPRLGSSLPRLTTARSSTSRTNRQHARRPMTAYTVDSDLSTTSRVLQNSDQHMRFESGQQALKHAQKSKRTSQMMSHRLEKPYYMCGSNKPLHSKYDVEGPHLELAKHTAHHMASARSRRSDVMSASQPCYPGVLQLPGESPIAGNLAFVTQQDTEGHAYDTFDVKVPNPSSAASSRPQSSKTVASSVDNGGEKKKEPEVPEQEDVEGTRIDEVADAQKEGEDADSTALKAIEEGKEGEEEGGGIVAVTPESSSLHQTALTETDARTDSTDTDTDIESSRPRTVTDVSETPTEKIEQPKTIFAISKHLFKGKKSDVLTDELEVKDLVLSDGMFSEVADEEVLADSDKRESLTQLTMHLAPPLKKDDFKVGDWYSQVPVTYSFVSAEQRDVFERHFRRIDCNKDGSLSIEELAKRMFDPPLTPTHAKQLFRVLDLNRDRSIDQREFVTILALNDRLTGRLTTSDDDTIELDLHKLSYYVQVYKEMFELVDSSGDGRLNLEEVMVVVTAGLHAQVGTDKKLMQALLDTMDTDNSGYVDFVEFMSHVPFFLQLHQAILEEPLGVANIERARIEVRKAMRPGRQYEQRKKTKDIWDSN